MPKRPVSFAEVTAIQAHSTLLDSEFGVWVEIRGEWIEVIRQDRTNPAKISPRIDLVALQKAFDAQSKEPEFVPEF